MRASRVEGRRGGSRVSGRGPRALLLTGLKNPLASHHEYSRSSVSATSKFLGSSAGVPEPGDEAEEEEEEEEGGGWATASAAAAVAA